MRIIRILFKLPALVVLGIGTLLKLIGDFAVCMSGALLRIIAAIIFLIAIACLIFQTATWSQSRVLIIVSFIFFTLPTIAGWLTDCVGGINHRLWRFVRS